MHKGQVVSKVTAKWLELKVIWANFYISDLSKNIKNNDALISSDSGNENWRG